MPMKVEEFDRGWLYMVAVASEEGTKAGDGGVVVLKNEAYDNTDGHLGVSEISGNVIPKNKGQYTLKQYFLGSRVPTWLTYVLPGDLFFLYEEAWNAFPDCITILTSKFMSNKKARISVRTLFFDEDSGVKENAHNLTASELAERKVFNLNIAEQDQTDKECKYIFITPPSSSPPISHSINRLTKPIQIHPILRPKRVRPCIMQV